MGPFRRQEYSPNNLKKALRYGCFMDHPEFMKRFNYTKHFLERQKQNGLSSNNKIVKIKKNVFVMKKIKLPIRLLSEGLEG